MCIMDTLPRSLIEKCNILARVINEVSLIYSEETCSEVQKQLIETMIGAAIWYLPQSIKLWTGKISLQALQEHNPESGIISPKLTADHLFPRKIAAIELLSKGRETEHLNGEILLKSYLERYGRFNFVTPTENRRLMQFQKKDVFKESDEAYICANIQLIAITGEQLKRIKARNLETIAACIK